MACKKDTSPEEEKNEIPSLTFVDLILFEDYYEKLPRDYTIEEASINGDTLKVTVSYLGGCKEHEFALLCADMFMYSIPPKALTVITHERHNDSCESTIIETLLFDLSPLKEKLSSPIVIILRGYEVEGEVLMYDFNGI